MFSPDHSFSTVENFFDLVMFFAIYKVWWWWWWFLVWEGGWCVWSKEYFVEHGVNAPVGWKFEGICGCLFFCCDFKWTCTFVGKLLFWLRKMKVGGIEPNLVTYFIFNCGFLFLVILGFHLVSSFFKGSFGFGMDFLHFGHECGRGWCSEGSLGFNAWYDIRIEAVIDFKGAFAGG